MNGKGPSSVALLFNFIIPFSEQLPTHDSIFAVFMCVCDSTITASSFKSMPDFVSVSIWDWLHVLIASEAKHPRNIRKFFLQKKPKMKTPTNPKNRHFHSDSLCWGKFLLSLTGFYRFV